MIAIQLQSIMKSILLGNLKATVAKSSLLASSDAIQIEESPKQKQPSMDDIKEEQHSFLKMVVSKQSLPYVKKSSLHLSDCVANVDDINAEAQTQNPQLEKRVFLKDGGCNVKGEFAEQTAQDHQNLEDVVKELQNRLPASNFKVQQDDWIEISNIKPSDLCFSQCSVSVQQIDIEENEDQNDQTLQSIQKNLSQNKFIKQFTMNDIKITPIPTNDEAFGNKDQQVQIFQEMEIVKTPTEENHTEVIEQEHKSFEQANQEKIVHTEFILEGSPNEQYKTHAQMKIQYTENETIVSIRASEENYLEGVTAELIQDMHEYFLSEYRILLPEPKKICFHKVKQQLQTLYMNFVWDHYPEQSLSFFKYNQLSSREIENTLLNRKYTRKRLSEKEKTPSSQKDKKFQNVLSKMLGFYEKFEKNGVNLEKLTGISICGHNKKLNYEMSKCLALLQWTASFDRAESNMICKLKYLESMRDMEAYIKAEICREEIKEFQLIKREQIKQAKRKIEESIPNFFPLH